MTAASLAVELDRAFVARGGPLGAGEELGVAADARRLEEGAVGLLRRVREVALEAVEQDRGAVLAQREALPPEPEREAEAGGRREQRIRALARQDRRRLRDADEECVQRLLELRLARGDRPQESLGVRDRRRAREGG